MKYLILLLCITGILNAAESPNLLKNSGFEKVKDGKAADWETFKEGYKISEDNVNDDGRYTVMFSGTAFTGGIAQYIYTKDTKAKFELSMDFLAVSFTAGKILPFYLTVISADGKINYVTLLTLTPDKVKPNGEYTKLKAVFDLGKYHTNGMFRVWCLAQDFTGTFYIDNFEVRKVTE